MTSTKAKTQKVIARDHVTKRFKYVEGEARHESKQYYGRIKRRGKWEWVKPYADKRSSQTEWDQILQDEERRAAGIITADMDAAQLSIDLHLQEYLELMKKRVSPMHHKITSLMLNRLVTETGWETLLDVTEKSLLDALAKMKHDKIGEYTTSYKNKFITRVKEFTRWCVPQRMTLDPLQKVKRFGPKSSKGKRLERRARRPLTTNEIDRLFAAVPPDRRLKYALAIYAGLRRSEAKAILCADIHLQSTIPFLDLRPEITKTGEGAAIPLHPYLVELIQAQPGKMPGATLLDSVPEKKTVRRDYQRAEIDLKDSRGRRVDFHSLRHTFASLLDVAGVTHGLRRNLLRHSSGDMTDRYTAAHLSAMYDAIGRLPRPDAVNDANVAKMEATNNQPVNISPAGVVVTGWSQTAPQVVANDRQSNTGENCDVAGTITPTESKATTGSNRRAKSATDLREDKNPDILLKSRAVSSVG